MNPVLIRATASLPNHQRLLIAIAAFFNEQPGVSAMLVSGSAAKGGMDEYSDLDLGFVCKDAQSRDAIWERRWDWEIAPWFHRFDADHIKPYFVIYFFDPNVHVDLNFYIEGDLPTPAGGPFTVAWDRTGQLETWAQKSNSTPAISPDWSQVVHEDERFWAWIHYASSHAARGEHYDATAFLPDLRSIVETWQARLEGRPHFSSRHAESRFGPAFISEMAQTFCQPSQEGLRGAFATLIRVQLKQRSRIEKQQSIRWNANPALVLERIPGSMRT